MGTMHNIISLVTSREEDHVNDKVRLGPTERPNVKGFLNSLSLKVRSDADITSPSGESEHIRSEDDCPLFGAHRGTTYNPGIQATTQYAHAPPPLLSLSAGTSGTDVVVPADAGEKKTTFVKESMA